MSRPPRPTFYGSALMRAGASPFGRGTVSCTGCGGTIVLGSSRCPRCGTKVVIPKPEMPGKEKWQNGLIYAAIVLILAVGAFLAVWGLAHGQWAMPSTIGYPPQ